MKYLTLPQVLLIAEDFTNTPAETLMRVSRIELLESALAAPKMEFEGLNPYPSISDKAAALAIHIVRNHPLQDGNKRLSLMCAINFFWINGFDLVIDLDESEELFFALAAGDVSFEELSNWFEARIVARTIS